MIKQVKFQGTSPIKDYKNSSKHLSLSASMLKKRNSWEKDNKRCVSFVEKKSRTEKNQKDKYNQEDNKQKILKYI